MATWRSMRDDNLRAAKLLAEDFPRSGASRAYYAVYAACCDVLESRSVPKTWHGRSRAWWYPHAELADLLEGLAEKYEQYGEPLLPPDQLSDLCGRIERLKNARVQADYVPATPLEAADMQDCLRDAVAVINLLADVFEVEQ